MADDDPRTATVMSLAAQLGVGAATIAHLANNFPKALAAMAAHAGAKPPPKVKAPDLPKEVAKVPPKRDLVVEAERIAPPGPPLIETLDRQDKVAAQKEPPPPAKPSSFPVVPNPLPVIMKPGAATAEAIQGGGTPTPTPTPTPPPATPPANNDALRAFIVTGAGQSSEATQHSAPDTKTPVVDAGSGSDSGGGATTAGQKFSESPLGKALSGIKAPPAPTPLPPVSPQGFHAITPMDLGTIIAQIGNRRLPPSLKSLL